MSILKNKKKLLIFGLVLIEIVSLFFMWKSSAVKETLLDNVKLKDEIKTDELFAIKVEQSDGTYADQTTIPLKSDGYIFNPDLSGCMDSTGRLIEDSLNYRNNMVRVNVTGSTYCYLYFDLITTGDFCIEEGITNFADCLLVMDNYSLDTTEAIEYIKSKGDATTSDTSPKYLFKSTETKGVDNSDASYIDYRGNYELGKSYKFNAETGMYTISSQVTDAIDNSYIGYYTCGGVYSCSQLYKINSYTTNSSGQQLITNMDIYDIESLESYDSETGLYATEDNDGITYVYRGNVDNNYVSFGGFIWRVVRINGDGSIRMIYAGTSATSEETDDQIAGTSYYTKYWAPQYVGYKNADDNISVYETTGTANFIVTEDKSYYFADSYTQVGTDKFKLSGNIVLSTWKDLYNSGDWENYHYTCIATTKTYECYLLRNIKGFYSNTFITATGIAAASPNYQATLANTSDSYAKETVDIWYQANILNATDSKGTQLTNYVDSNAEFCNDRSVYSGNGYTVAPATTYMAHRRLQTLYKPSLLCGQTQDIFSVKNGNLTYPVALLTADEASFAGIRSTSNNPDNYLVTGTGFWTMTPAIYNATYVSSRVYVINAAGGFNVTTGVNNGRGIRPVINLVSNVKVASGKGTASSPYVLTMS